jgi:RimJ/RimL family protein N-acetyltransferase
MTLRIELVPIPADGAPWANADNLPQAAVGALAATEELYREGGYQPPWIGYLAEENGFYVGACAFKSVPDDGQVEIAYFTFPGHEGRGVATQMVRSLLHLATTARPDVTLTAETLPEENASTTILRRAGFERAGQREDPVDGTVWRWRLRPGARPSPSTCHSIGRPGVQPSDPRGGSAPRVDRWPL